MVPKGGGKGGTKTINYGPTLKDYKGYTWKVWWTRLGLLPKGNRRKKGVQKLRRKTPKNEPYKVSKVRPRRGGGHNTYGKQTP